MCMDIYRFTVFFYFPAVVSSISILPATLPKFRVTRYPLPRLMRASFALQ